MSTTILSDIARKNDRDAYDILPIIENTCDYHHHLASKVLSSEDLRLSMCILDMYTLDGEVMRDNGVSLSALKWMIVIEYLDSVALDSFRPHVDGYHLFITSL